MARATEKEETVHWIRNTAKNRGGNNFGCEISKTTPKTSIYIQDIQDTMTQILSHKFA